MDLAELLAGRLATCGFTHGASRLRCGLLAGHPGDHCEIRAVYFDSNGSRASQRSARFHRWAN